MYAVWGGHVECVKYLVSNDFGVSKLGVKRSSLDMITTKGYTALHLAGIVISSSISFGVIRKCVSQRLSAPKTLAEK